MPSKPKKPCLQPGCSEIVASGRCDKHARQTRKATPRATVGGSAYGRDWPRIRASYIYRHPWCVVCGLAAKVADHFPLSFVKLKAANVSDPHSDHRLRALCLSCHSRETGVNQPGGVVAERRIETEADRVYRRFTTERDELPPF